MSIRFRWSARKRAANLVAHGLDFADARGVFAGPTFTFEDDRFRYAEQRFVTLGFQYETAVSIVHTESEHEIRVISFRRATRKEAAILFEALERAFPPGGAG